MGFYVACMLLSDFTPKGVFSQILVKLQNTIFNANLCGHWVVLLVWVDRH